MANGRPERTVARKKSLTGREAGTDSPTRGVAKLAAAVLRPAFNLNLPQRSLTDQFGSETCAFKVETFVCNPAEKNSEGPPANPSIHQLSYKIVCPTPFVKIPGVRVVDQFNPNGVSVDLLKKFNVLVPSGKTNLGPVPPPPLQTPPGTPPPLTVDHFLCYKVKGPIYKVAPIAVTVTDQLYPTLPGYPGLKLLKMTKLCTPVDKAGEDPSAPNHVEHLACYQAKLPKGTVFAKTVVATNNTNFGAQVLTVKNTGELCVPAREIDPRLRLGSGTDRKTVAR